MTTSLPTYEELMERGALLEYADAVSIAPIDVHKAIRRKDIVLSKNQIIHSSLEEIPVSVQKTEKAAKGNKLDAHVWLGAAAKAYHISAKLSDYVIVPVFTIPSDLPNRNGVGFSKKELVKWNLEQGAPAFKTFKGRPTYVEHNNKIPEQASGVILDAFLRPLKGYGGGKVWKLVELLAFDRSKNEELCSQILSGERNAYSMGALVKGYTCSVCEGALGHCGHLNTRSKVQFQVLESGKLAYKLARDITGYETSSVSTPAYTQACTDFILMS